MSKWENKNTQTRANTTHIHILIHKLNDNNIKRSNVTKDLDQKRATMCEQLLGEKQKQLLYVLDYEY